MPTPDQRAALRDTPGGDAYLTGYDAGLFAGLMQGRAEALDPDSHEDHQLFHGHHPACGYTLEGDWSACCCGAQPVPDSAGLRTTEKASDDNSHAVDQPVPDSLEDASDQQVTSKWADSLDVETLGAAIYEVSVRHDWANTLDTEDRTEEIAAEYARLRDQGAEG